LTAYASIEFLLIVDEMSLDSKVLMLADRYSLKKSGWHRFWFAIVFTVVVTVILSQFLHTPESRQQTRKDIEAARQLSCKQSCEPKNGVMTQVPLNPLHTGANATGWRREPVFKCECY
jgi:hypothetical protein